MITKDYKNYIYLHGGILFFSFSSVMAKLASGYAFLTVKFNLFYGLELLIFMIYAVLWQQIIKGFSISTAYAHRSVVIIWSLIFASLFFHEPVSFNNVLGSGLVLCGMVFVSYG